jgi:hypothetical protein
MSALRTTSVLAAAASIAAGVLIASQPAGAAVACGNSSLTSTYSRSEGAAGHATFVLAFRNTSRSTCSIFGYPGLDAIASSGAVLAHAQRTLNGMAGGAHTETTVVLKPGQWASARVEWMSFNPSTGGGCAVSASVHATPAGTSHTVNLPVSVTNCVLRVHPTVAGVSGNN